MQCFISHEVDVAILEVGLGAGLDAVNVFDSDCAVVTSIAIDHTDYLGDTREKIAFEKAGIFRAAKWLCLATLICPMPLRQQAQKIGARLWCLGKQFSFKAANCSGLSGHRQQAQQSAFPGVARAFQLNNAVPCSPYWKP